MESDISSFKADGTVTTLSDNLALTPIVQPVFVHDGYNPVFQYITNAVTKRSALCPGKTQTAGYMDNVDIKFDLDVKNTGLAVNSTKTGRIQNSDNLQDVFYQTGNYLPDTPQINSLKTMSSLGLHSHTDKNNEYLQGKLSFCQPIAGSQMTNGPCNLTYFNTSVASEMQSHAYKKVNTDTKANNEDIKPRADLSGQSKRKSTYKRYVCAYCDARFKLKFNMKSHERIHTEERPYTCDDCGARFRHGPTLTTHRRIHTGEKPFVCSFCQAKFAQTSGLKSHQRIHTREKPYNCSVCGAKFARSDTLNSHMNGHGYGKGRGKGGHLVCPFCDLTFRSNQFLLRHKRDHLTTR